MNHSEPLRTIAMVKKEHEKKWSLSKQTLVQIGGAVSLQTPNSSDDDITHGGQLFVEVMWGSVAGRKALRRKAKVDKISRQGHVWMLGSVTGTRQHAQGFTGVGMFRGAGARIFGLDASEHC